jgi:uncharacterized membrane protein
LDLILGALPSFAASAVEFVEALTIVLVVGVTRGWRASIAGASAAALVLAIAVVAAGPAITRVPEHAFKLVVGILLLLFGLRWTRKAILRSAGVVALHDEKLIFERQQRTLAALSRGEGFDWVGATISFKATALEGLEVVFIVLALGAKGGTALTGACLGALSAFVVVVVAGFAVRQPLSRVPENTLKFVVGGMLSTFGAFWAGEGLGVAWPGDAISLLVLLAATAGLSAIAVRFVRSQTTSLTVGAS